MGYEVVVEHLNHLGIVAEVCREIGVAEWLSAQDPTSRQRVSVGLTTKTAIWPFTKPRNESSQTGLVPIPKHVISHGTATHTLCLLTAVPSVEPGER
jgi:hypothetical protein